MSPYYSDRPIGPAPAVGALRAYVDEFTAQDEYGDQEAAIADWMTAAAAQLQALEAECGELLHDAVRWRVSVGYDDDAAAMLPERIIADAQRHTVTEYPSPARYNLAAQEIVSRVAALARGRGSR
jgi:hypothetical protein